MFQKPKRPHKKGTVKPMGTDPQMTKDQISPESQIRKMAAMLMSLATTKSPGKTSGKRKKIKKTRAMKK